MEAENNNTPQEAPEFEQQMLDTQNETSDGSFEQALGLPTPEETAPPTHQETQQLVEKEVMVPAKEDFSQNEVAPESNDQVRYNYWQSEAAKLKNELDGYKEYAPMVDYLRNNPDAVQNLTPGESKEKTQEPVQEEFPPPPVKPEQPVGFSREEAHSDRASESAKYLNEVEKWRDDMLTYGQLQNQYEIASMRESYNKKIEDIQKVEETRQAEIKQHQEMNNVKEFVRANYDLGENVDDFVTTMNDPNSINMDDLVAYYKFKKGMPQTQNNTVTPNQPSPSFNQIKRAQSVPTPMGVQSSANTTNSDANNQFMDLLINDNKNKSIL